MDGHELPTMSGRRAGFRMVYQFSAVTFTSTVDATIKVFLANDDVQLGGLNVINDTAHPVNVMFAGTVDPVIGTLDNTDANAVPVQPQTTAVWTTKEELPTAITAVAPVAVDDVGVVLLAADATRRGVRFYNDGTSTVALIPVGGTFAASVCRIQPGETWNENEAPGVAWNAVCDAGESSTINILKL
jgi:hypothetical protein